MSEDGWKSFLEEREIEIANQTSDPKTLNSWVFVDEKQSSWFTRDKEEKILHALMKDGSRKHLRVNNKNRFYMESLLHVKSIKSDCITR